LPLVPTLRALDERAPRHALPQDADRLVDNDPDRSLEAPVVEEA
jgi:hypothetical protein